MKKIFTLFCVLFLLGLGTQSVVAQLLYQEDFNFATNAVLSAQAGWLAHSGAGSNSPFVVDSNITLAGVATYPDAGKALYLRNTGEDVNYRFTATQADSVTTGVLYASFLVRVISVPTNSNFSAVGDYFFHFGDYGASVNGSTTMNTADFWARLYVRKSNTSDSALTFGIAKGALETNHTPMFTDSIYHRNANYLIVVKYDFWGGDTAAANASLFVFKAGDDWTTEPGTPNAGPSLTSAPQFGTNFSGAPEISFVCFRQGGGANSASFMVIDGIHIGKSWNDAPMPVELSSFTASTRNGRVDLNWTTKTEVSNHGFEVQRSVVSDQSTGKNWSKVAFVEGHGTTNAPQNYSYTDNAASVGKYSYRLKQIDRDGKFEYSKEVEAVVGMTPNTMTLGQNYPNPFNPETNIEFAVPKSGFTTLKVYNTLGEEVSTLVYGIVQAGVLNKVTFNRANLGSGMYYYTLRSGSFLETKKMLMLK